MAQSSEAAIAELLRESEAAHAEYETSALGGVYDSDWPRWYARDLLARCLAQLLPHGAGDVEHLAAVLKGLAEDYERERPAQAWPDAYARRLAAVPG